MAAQLHYLEQRRLIDSNGIADSATIGFYNQGTLNPISIYADSSLSVPLQNPLPVSAGAAVPNIYYDDTLNIRRIITYSDGSTDDANPYILPSSVSDAQAAAAAAAADAAQTALDRAATAADAVNAQAAKTDAETAAANAQAVVASGFSYLDPVAAATITNITLSGEQTIDDITTSTSRVLVKDQTAPEENGVYDTAAGAWSRVSGMSAAADVQGKAVFVEGGTSNGGKAFATFSEVTTLGTDAIDFVNIQDVNAVQGQIDALVSRLPDPDYANDGGTGDRTASITITSGDGVVGLGDPQDLVNGNTTTSDIRFAAGGSITGTVLLQFDFGSSANKVIDQLRFIRSSTTSLGGNFKVQGSLDGLAWTDISVNFAISGSLSQTQDIDPGQGWRFFRILGVSGTFASGTGIFREVEFRIDVTALDGVRLPPSGGEASKALILSGDGESLTYGPAQTNIPTTGLLGEWAFDDRTGTTVTARRGSFNIDFPATSTARPEWTSKGVRFRGDDYLELPTLTNVKTVAMLFKLPTIDDTTGFVASATSQNNILRPSLNDAGTTVHVGIGAGVAPNSDVISNVRRWNRGGWVLVFVEMTTAFTDEINIGRRHNNTNFVADMEFAWMAVYNTALSDADRDQIYSSVRMLARERGIYIHWEDTPNYIDGVGLWGQSNAGGRALIADLSAAEQARDYLHTMIAPSNGADLSAWLFPEKLVIGRNQTRTTVKTWFGPELGFAVEREDGHTTRERPLAFTKTTAGGTGLDPVTVTPYWATSGGAADLFWQAVKQWWNAEQFYLNQGIGLRPSGLAWVQGEADATDATAAGNYQTNMQSLWDTAKAQIGFEAMAVLRLNSALDTGTYTELATVQAAQDAFGAANADVTVINSDAITMGVDGVHYDADEQFNDIGPALYAGIF